MKSEVAKYIREHNMISSQDTIIVGLSGGADSVALLLSLLDLGYTCKAAHCNFLLRGEDSDRDEAFVSDLCERLGVELKVILFETKECAKLKGISIEMAARELRYDWFNYLIESGYGSKIAIAHHRDDNVETFFLNLTRGAGLKGLCGIQPVNGNIIRPLLDLSRVQIEDYLQKKEQSYVVDCTNLEDEFARNKIRLHVIPMLEKINTACQANVDQAMKHLNQSYLIYQKAISESIARVRKDNVVDIQLLLQEVSPETVLHELFSPLGINRSQLADMIKSLRHGETKEFITPTHRIIKNRDLFLIDSEGASVNCPPQLDIQRVTVSEHFVIPKDSNVACFDAELITTSDLTCRRWQEGDVFVPFGMTGKKRLSDFFIDNKYTISDKESQWLLLHGEDIIWVIGKRIDNRFRVTKDTKELLIVKY